MHRVIEQPHKVHYMAVLLSLLFAPMDPASDAQVTLLGPQLLQHCWKFFKETTEDSDLQHIRPWVPMCPFARLSLYPLN